MIHCEANTDGCERIDKRFKIQRRVSRFREEFQDSEKRICKALIKGEQAKVKGELKRNLYLNLLNLRLKSDWI